MKQFKITYQYQDFRTVQTNYAFISADNARAAQVEFEKTWICGLPLTILKIEQVGIL